MKHRNLLLFFSEPHIFFVLFLLVLGVLLLFGDGILNFSNNYGVLINVGKYKYLIGGGLIIVALYGFYVIHKSKDQRRYICMECAVVEYGKKGTIPSCKKCGNKMKLSWKE